MKRFYIAISFHVEIDGRGIQRNWYLLTTNYELLVDIKRDSSVSQMYSKWDDLIR